MALTILLVDDDPLMHRMLVPRLEALGTTPPVTMVLSARTPDEALAAVRDAPDAPLVVVTDFNLKATTNGLELLRRVRDARPDTLRVLFSGYSQEQLGDVVGDEVHEFLEKPLLLDELLEPLSRFISSRLGP